MKVDIGWIDDKLSLRYPCEWVYKIIGKNAGVLRSAVTEIVGDDGYSMKFSNFSAKGTYICLNLEMTVSSEEQRNEIFHALKQHDAIKMVL